MIPELKGRLDGTAIRIPTPNVSLVSLDVVLKAQVTVLQINDAMKAASREALRGILDYTEEKLVSVDFNHVPARSTQRKPQLWTMDSSMLLAGTTMSGAFLAACWIRQRCLVACRR